MMPTIRVDDDVYGALRSRGRTGDSFSDVLRPLLELTPKHSSKTEIELFAEMDKETAYELIDSANDEVLKIFAEIVFRYLPNHWADSPMRARQILFVIAEFMKQPQNMPTAGRHNKAAKSVAGRFGVVITTIHDKCGRQLYGTGTANQIGTFRRALEQIETEWRHCQRPA